MGFVNLADSSFKVKGTNQTFPLLKGEGLSKLEATKPPADKVEDFQIK